MTAELFVQALPSFQFLEIQTFEVQGKTAKKRQKHEKLSSPNMIFPARSCGARLLVACLIIAAAWGHDNSFRTLNGLDRFKSIAPAVQATAETLRKLTAAVARVEDKLNSLQRHRHRHRHQQQQEQEEDAPATPGSNSSNATAGGAKPLAKCSAYRGECKEAGLPFLESSQAKDAPSTKGLRRRFCCDHKSPWAKRAKSRFAKCTAHLDDAANACDNVMVIVEGSHDLRRRATTQRMARLFGAQIKAHHRLCLVLLADPRLLDEERRLHKERSVGTLKDALAVADEVDALAADCVLPNHSTGSQGGGNAATNLFLGLMEHLADRGRHVFLSFSSHGHKDLRGTGSHFGQFGGVLTSRQIKAMAYSFTRNKAARLLAVWSACYSGGYFSHLYRGKQKISKRAGLWAGNADKKDNTWVEDPFHMDAENKKDLEADLKRWTADGASILTKWASRRNESGTGTGTGTGSKGIGPYPGNVVFFTSSFPHFTAVSDTYQDGGEDPGGAQGGNPLARAVFDAVTQRQAELAKAGGDKAKQAKVPAVTVKAVKEALRQKLKAKNCELTIAMGKQKVACVASDFCGMECTAEKRKQPDAAKPEAQLKWALCDLGCGTATSGGGGGSGSGGSSGGGSSRSKDDDFFLFQSMVKTYASACESYSKNEKSKVCAKYLRKATVTAGASPAFFRLCKAAGFAVGKAPKDFAEKVEDLGEKCVHLQDPDAAANATRSPAMLDDVCVIPFSHCRGGKGEVARANKELGGFLKSVVLNKQAIDGGKRWLTDVSLADGALAPKSFKWSTCVFDRDKICGDSSTGTTSSSSSSSSSPNATSTRPAGGQRRLSSVRRWYAFTDTFKFYPGAAWHGSEDAHNKTIDQDLAELFPPIAASAKFLLF